ncbi:sigma-54 interaction domain-containing protein [Syntrophobacter fumaroxidans]|uniref:Sigma54 specific transcriptional regulator, Fis family n=1 Tax=Syntrophobacter fumaroxidans (strain DSM 10017 / MPOB) TaxID=335543 RepID=A0LHF1_SYNFM|nr:sigma-54-dependent Fis family transcriptional regulator [Syntrophobacter fumaroxidans]ABK16853.1 sigma54 specific transcriptional regulator, Fis family [Syntrophobacter fumaroxidans MPOB]
MGNAGETDKTIRERADKFQSIFENSTMGIFQSSLDGRFLAVNPAFAKIFGYASPEDLIESIQSIDSQFYRRSEQRGKILSAIENKTGMARFEAEFLRKEGTVITCSLSIRAIRDGSGAITHLDGFIEDVTEATLRKKEIQERTEHLSRENLRLRNMFKDRYRLGKIVGKSAAMQEVFEGILQAAGTEVAVMIHGESGTGKELVANAIHDLSRRRSRRFVPVNCGAIPLHLLESEFFGHRKGAYTGAVSDTRGFLERADGGTLFLDEVGELSLDMQVKLLRALEGGHYFPLGESRPAESDFRLISATNRNLKDMVRDGRMREDFFFRIDIVPIDLPPLRQRREDIPLLIDHFLRHFTGAENPPVLPGKVLEALYKYDYPGNIRELQNILQRYLATKRLGLLGSMEHERAAEISGQMEEAEVSLHDEVSRFEKSVIEKNLVRHRWNRIRTAAALKIDRKTLYTKMKTYGLLSPGRGE